MNPARLSSQFAAGGPVSISPATRLLPVRYPRALHLNEPIPWSAPGPRALLGQRRGVAGAADNPADRIEFESPRSVSRACNQQQR